MTERYPRSMSTGALRALQAFLGPNNVNKIGAPGLDEERSASVEIVPFRSKAQAVRSLEAAGMTQTLSFVILPSVSDTRFLLPVGPAHIMLSGLASYQPLRLMPRVAKRALAIAAQCGWTGWTRYLSVVGSQRALKIEQLVRSLCGESKPFFSLKLGTAGPQQKLVVRVMRSTGKLIGYMKIPLTDEATCSVMREANTLRRLSHYSVINGDVPTLLHCGHWGHTYLLFQSGVESRVSPSRFGESHRSFLQKLASIERSDVPADVIIERVTEHWKRAEPTFLSAWRDLGRSALAAATRVLSGNRVPCALSHGDFAPWNTLLSNGRLFVYDWEGAEWERPVAWDAMHFFVQCGAFLGQHRRLKTFRRSAGMNVGLFILYLLDSTRMALADGSTRATQGARYRYGILESVLAAL